MVQTFPKWWELSTLKSKKLSQPQEQEKWANPTKQVIIALLRAKETEKTAQGAKPHFIHGNKGKHDGRFLLRDKSEGSTVTFLKT